MANKAVPKADTTDDNEGGHAKAISKAEAVRQALAAGNDSPEDGVGYLKSIHGIEMTRQSFSSYKAQEKARQAKKGTKGKSGRYSKAAPSQAVEGYLAPPPKPSTNGDPDLIEAMEAMKPLVVSLGAEKVKRLVDLLG